MAANKKLDVILWAHSDQAGGTEIPCVIASALLRRTGRGISCGIVTPFPSAVADFFSIEGGLRGGVKIIRAPQLLELGKDTSGEVSAQKTLAVVKDLIKDKAGTGRGSGQKAAAAWVGECERTIEGRYHENTCIISCGEPIAVEVARRSDLDVLIISDHLLTQSVKAVLEPARRSVEVDAFLEALEHFERPVDGGVAFLSPPEFGMSAYKDYLVDDRKWRQCMELSGLFYDPIPPHELECAPHYDELRDLNRKCPVVIVFGGGGHVWDKIYCSLHDAVQAGKLGEQGEPGQFALIVRDVLDGKVIPRTWRLFKPGDRQGTPLKDPGKMMYWYAASTILVGRGGLAAQQVLASMLSDAPSAPRMLFIEEPHHPQIESERRQLRDLGLVQTYMLDDFAPDPFEGIREVLKMDLWFQDARHRTRLRYAPATMDRLADLILQRYAPHRHPLLSREKANPEAAYDYASTFMEKAEDRLEIPGALEGKLPPLQLEVHPPPDDPECACVFDCPHCFKQGFDCGVSEYVSEDALTRTIKDFKGRVGRIVISGLYTSPLCSSVTPAALQAARTGFPQKVGLHTKLVAPGGKLPQEFVDALFRDCRDGDYLTVSLDAGTAETYARVTKTSPRKGAAFFEQCKVNLQQVKKLREDSEHYPKGHWLRLNMVYLLIDGINTGEDDIAGAVNIARATGVDCLRFSVPLPNFDEGNVPPTSSSEIKSAAAFIRNLSQDSDNPRMLVRLYPEWSLEGFQHCRSQLFTPALGADGYFYPCCQVACRQFENLRIEQAAIDANNWNRWFNSKKRKGLLHQQVGQRLGTEPECMNCRVCNRKDGTINALLRAYVMSDK